MKARAFTLIELIITVSILAVVSATSFQAFSLFHSRSDSHEISATLQSIISEADRQVRDGMIGSYEVYFSTGAKGSIFITDPIGLSESGTLSSYDWDTGSGLLDLVSPISGTWTIRTLRDSKIFETASFSGTAWTFPLRFPPARHNERSISIWFDSDPKNSIALRPFQTLGWNSDEESQTVLSSIRSGTFEYEEFVIRNVLGKKEFLVSGISVGTVTLTLSKGAKTFDIELRK